MDESQGRGLGAGQSRHHPLPAPPPSQSNLLPAGLAGSVVSEGSLLTGLEWACGPIWCFLTLTSSHLAAGILSEPTAVSTLTGPCRKTQGGTAVWSPTQLALSKGMWSWLSRVSPGAPRWWG